MNLGLQIDDGSAKVYDIIMMANLSSTKKRKKKKIRFLRTNRRENFHLPLPERQQLELFSSTSMAKFVS
jgi:hypothetical protein